MYQNSAFPSFIPVGTGVLVADDLGAAAAVHGEYLCVKACQVNRIMFNVSTLVAATTTAPVVRFSKRVLQGSDTGAVVIGSLTIPDTTAVGKVLYKDVTPMNFKVGDTLKVENTQITVGGGAAGGGYYAFESYEDPEDRKEQSDMVLSA